MKKQLLLTLVVAFGFLLMMTLVPICQAQSEDTAEAQSEDTAEAQSEEPGETQSEDADDSVTDSEAEAEPDSVAPSSQRRSRRKLPAVFQAAGPTAASIQSTVDAFRAALGDPNNANAPGPLAVGRREINWDGGGNVDTTTAPVTPFDVFLNTRGARFTTPGKGLSQAPPIGPVPIGGLAGLFNNLTYSVIFQPFSPLRLFTPVKSKITEGEFFIPGVNPPPSPGVPLPDPVAPAVVTGFGAVFSDVDEQPDGRGHDNKDGRGHDNKDGRGHDNKDGRGHDNKDGRGHDKERGNCEAGTLITFFDADDKVLFSGVVPASPGDATFSFFGIVFEKALIARVRIQTGNTAPGPNDGEGTDVVMMDDFIYGEPQDPKSMPPPLPVVAP
jgi:hypothetical protein